MGNRGSLFYGATASFYNAAIGEKDARPERGLPGRKPYIVRILL